MAEEKMHEVEIDLSDEDFLVLAKMAHEKNITFNQMCILALEEMIAYYDRKEKESQEG